MFSFKKIINEVLFLDYRLFCIRSIRLPVMCGATAWSCMRYGVWEELPTMAAATLR